jgi:hypothetical protein
MVVAIVAVIGFLLLWPSRPGTAIPGRLQSAGGSAGGAVPAGAAAGRGAETAGAEAKSSDPIVDLIHKKLSEWLQARRDGAEDGETLAMQALMGLLTDENAGSIIQSLSPAEMNTPFGFEGIRHWMNANPIEASNWFANRKDATEEEAGAVAQWWSGNEEGFQSYLNQLPDAGWKENLLQEAGNRMAATDPAEAIKLAGEMDIGDAQTGLLRTAVCNWIGTDPNAAYIWLQSVADPGMREQLISAAAQAYALTDPSQAAAWITGLGNFDGATEEAALNIAETWSQSDPSAAAKWVAQFPAGEDRTSAINTVLLHWLPSDAGEAEAWILTLPEEDQAQAAGTIATQWSMRDPAGAANWAAALPEGQARAQAIGQVVTSWLGTDAAAAGEWAQQLPEGSSRDAAIEAYAAGTVASDPQDAAALAASISDPAARGDTLASICKQWLKADAAAAARWIAGSDVLAAGVKAQLLQRNGP